MTELEEEFTYIAMCQEFPPFNVWMMDDYHVVITGVKPSREVQEAVMRLHKVFEWAVNDEGFLAELPKIEFKPKGFA